MKHLTISLIQQLIVFHSWTNTAFCRLKDTVFFIFFKHSMRMKNPIPYILLQGFFFKVMVVCLFNRVADIAQWCKCPCVVGWRSILSPLVNQWCLVFSLKYPQLTANQAINRKWFICMPNLTEQSNWYIFYLKFTPEINQ